MLENQRFGLRQAQDNDQLGSVEHQSRIKNPNRAVLIGSMIFDISDNFSGPTLTRDRIAQLGFSDENDLLEKRLKSTITDTLVPNILNNETRLKTHQITIGFLNWLYNESPFQNLSPEELANYAMGILSYDNVMDRLVYGPDVELHFALTDTLSPARLEVLKTNLNTPVWQEPAGEPRDHRRPVRSGQMHIELKDSLVLDDIDVYNLARATLQIPWVNTPIEEFKIEGEIVKETIYRMEAKYPNLRFDGRKRAQRTASLIRLLESDPKQFMGANGDRRLPELVGKRLFETIKAIGVAGLIATIESLAA